MAVIAYPPSSIAGALAARRSGLGTSQPSESAMRTIMLKSAHTAAASRRAASETPAARAVSASAGPISSGRSVSFSRKTRAAASSGRTGAVRQSATTASQTSSPSAYDATAPWEPAQNGHCRSSDVKPANSSRSPALHSDGPRMTTSSTSENGSPKSSGR